MSFTQIETSRLLLDPVEKHNLRLLWQLMQEPDLRDFQDIPRVPFERFGDRLRQRSHKLFRGARGRFEWLMLCKPHFEPIGWISLRFQERLAHRGELGYSVLLPSRRQGYASEAVAALNNAMFAGSFVDSIDAYCLPTNIGSRGVLQRAGLTERQRVARGAIVRGQAVDILRYEVTAAKWQLLDYPSLLIQDRFAVRENQSGSTTREEHKAER